MAGAVNQAGAAGSQRPEPLPSYIAASVNKIEREFSAGGVVEAASEQAIKGQPGPNFGPQNNKGNGNKLDQDS